MSAVFTWSVSSACSNCGKSISNSDKYLHNAVCILSWDSTEQKWICPKDRTAYAKWSDMKAHVITCDDWTTTIDEANWAQNNDSNTSLTMGDWPESDGSGSQNGQSSSQAARRFMNNRLTPRSHRAQLTSSRGRLQPAAGIRGGGSRGRGPSALSRRPVMRTHNIQAAVASVSHALPPTNAVPVPVNMRMPMTQARDGFGRGRGRLTRMSRS